MKTIVLHVLCEGQTEQGFVDKVLKPYLQEHGINSVKSTILTTNKKKNAYGGMLSYRQVCRDFGVLLKSYIDDAHTKHFFTTMFDYYALPSDFPGFSTVVGIQDKNLLIETLEKALGEEINNDSFIPYLQLHEFESLVFCGLDYLEDLYPDCNKNLQILKKVMIEFNSPELINNGKSTAPSKRIIAVIEDNGKTGYKYNKPQSGKYITECVGIDNLRKLCPHFNKWIETIIAKCQMS